MKRGLGVVLFVVGCQNVAPPAPLQHTILSDPGPGEIRASTQVIRLRFLDEYRPALARFGLEAVDLEVRRATRGTGRFTDGSVLARRAASSLSLVRGARSTAARVHTIRDVPEGLGFRTAAAVGEAVSVNGGEGLAAIGGESLATI